MLTSLKLHNQIHRHKPFGYQLMWALSAETFKMMHDWVWHDIRNQIEHPLDWQINWGISERVEALLRDVVPTFGR